MQLEIVATFHCELKVAIKDIFTCNTGQGISWALVEVQAFSWIMRKDIFSIFQTIKVHAHDATAILVNIALLYFRPLDTDMDKSICTPLNIYIVK